MLKDTDRITNVFMDGPSLEYYISVFRNSPQKISSVKELILKDFEAMELQFHDAMQKNDMLQMRRELHRMRPIVSNLRFTRMMELLDKYENNETAPTELVGLNDELNDCLTEIYYVLKK